MMLAVLIAVLVLGGVLAWAGEHARAGLARWIALAVVSVDALLIAKLWQTTDTQRVWLARLDLQWIPAFGIRFQLALDGLSLLLLALTAFLGLIAVLASWREIRERAGFFYFSLLWTLAGVMGVFTAFDLFLFFVFWEVMLVPMYFLIAIWGHQKRRQAAFKFFIYTQASGLLMLVAILALAYASYHETGTLTFAYLDLLGTPLSPAGGLWIMLGFFVAFAVKLPALPLHTWLPDAHTEAPTGGSVILAGVLLKTGAYGLLRFVVPLFPAAARDLAPWAMALGAAAILYGAVLAFAQTDFKRLVAYTSVSHMGFVLLGIFAWHPLALQGAVMQMLAHGIGTGALFMIAGAVQARLHTRDLGQMGGLWSALPRLGAWALFFAVAALGLPGLGNFVGEFLVLLGSFAVRPGVSIIAALGLIAAAVYALALVQRAFHGTGAAQPALVDAGLRETAAFLTMALALIWLGLFPQPVFDIAQPALEVLQRAAALPGRIP
jgi:NADH-quinone oxidoreductase subunit M